MKSNKLSYSEKLCVVACGSRVQSLNDGGYIAKDRGVHQGCNKQSAISDSKKRPPAYVPHVHPVSMTRMQNIFSVLVVGETLPKPTDVNEEKVK